MKAVFKRPYVYYVVLVFILYMGLNVWISGFYNTIMYVPYYLESVRWDLLIIGLVLSIIIGSLIAINTVYSVYIHKKRKRIAKETALTCTATIGGLAMGVCSACIEGVVPLIFSAIGTSFSWASLPFKGMEIQLLIIVVLSYTLYSLIKLNNGLIKHETK